MGKWVQVKQVSGFPLFLVVPMGSLPGSFGYPLPVESVGEVFVWLWLLLLLVRGFRTSLLKVVLLPHCFVRKGPINSGISISYLYNHERINLKLILFNLIYKLSLIFKIWNFFVTQLIIIDVSHATGKGRIFWKFTYCQYCKKLGLPKMAPQHWAWRHSEEQYKN